jgi:hypothetical protein
VATGIDVAALVGSTVACSAAGDDVGPGLAGDAVVPQATSPSTTTDRPADASQTGILLGRLKLKMTEGLPAVFGLLIFGLLIFSLPKIAHYTKCFRYMAFDVLSVRHGAILTKTLHVLEG